MAESTSSERVILAFDIGIRNLAWCSMAAGGAGAAAKPAILGWQNYDLLAGDTAGAAAAAAKRSCCRCSVSASYWNTEDGNEKPTCARHCPVSRPPLKDLSGVAIKRFPPVAELRAAATAAGLSCSRSASKSTVLGLLSSRYSLPLEKVKLKKAVEHDLILIHDAIRGFVLANADLFRQSTQICLENQPVLKNPTMKTVQILLFATLRDVLQPAPPPIKLVHAARKGKGRVAATVTGDAGYKARKDASEGAVLAALEGGRVQEAATWLAKFRGQAKKSDLADAFCMCCDALGLGAA